MLGDTAPGLKRRHDFCTMWDKASVEIANAEKSAQRLLVSRLGKVGHGLDLFRKGVTSVAADFVAEVLNGRLSKTALRR